MKNSVLSLIIILFSYSSITSQNVSEDLKEHIDEEIETIDAKINEEEYTQALSRIESIERYKGFISQERNLIEINFRKAKILYGQGEVQTAMKLLLDNLAKIDKKTDFALHSMYVMYLGEIFELAKNIPRARYYYRTGLNNSVSAKDTANILDFLFKLGNSHYKEEELDSANYFYTEVTTYNFGSSDSDYLAKAFNNLGVVASDNGELEIAEEYARRVLEIRKAQKDSIKTAAALSNLSAIFYEKGDFETSENYYYEAIDLVRGNPDDRAIRIYNNLLFNLAYVNEEQSSFEKAYKYLEKATNLADSLANANITQNISEIEAKYNVEKQAAETEREKRKRAQAQALFYGTALAFLALLALGYIFYRNYRLKQQARLDLIENESQTKIINATIDAKEKERKAIAETLHDSVSALLSSANLHLQATKAQLKQKSPQEITKAQTIVNEASVKIRDLSHELISSVLLKFGLAFAVHDMCQKYSNSELTLHSDDDGIKRYHQDFEIKIHNIIEELINNILKHSKASNATVMLAHKENDMLSVRISDDGVGFNPRQVRGKDGLGLSHIEARIKVMKGVFNIISSKDNGTNIFILVPIQFKESTVSA